MFNRRRRRMVMSAQWQNYFCLMIILIIYAVLGFRICISTYSILSCTSIIYVLTTNHFLGQYIIILSSNTLDSSNLPVRSHPIGILSILLVLISKISDISIGSTTSCLSVG